MAVIAVLTRVERSVRRQIEREWEQVDGVSLVDVDQRDRLGVVIERDTVAAAEGFLHEHIETTAGVLGAWPVYVHYGDDAAVAADSFTPTPSSRQFVSAEDTRQTAEQPDERS